MIGRKRLSRESVWDDKQRQQILNLIAISPKSITQIENQLKINRGNVKHHLGVLLEHKFIEKTKQENVTGKPTIISISPQAHNFLREKLKEQEAINKRLEEIFQKIKPEADLIVGEAADKFKNIQKTKEFKDYKKQPKTE
jgi:DNA-binding MarR family transcriptional regulator